jgi:hypothetical protein
MCYDYCLGAESGAKRRFPSETALADAFADGRFGKSPAHKMMLGLNMRPATGTAVQHQISHSGMDVDYATHLFQQFWLRRDLNYYPFIVQQDMVTDIQTAIKARKVAGAPASADADVSETSGPMGDVRRMFLQQEHLLMDHYATKRVHYPVLHLLTRETVQGIETGSSVWGTKNVGLLLFDSLEEDLLGWVDGFEQKFDLFICGSVFCAQTLRKHGQHKVLVVPVGADTDFFQQAAADDSPDSQHRAEAAAIAQAAGALGINDLRERFVVYSAGVLQPAGGQVSAVSSFPDCR